MTDTKQQKPKVVLLVNGTPGEFEMIFDSPRTGEHNGKPWWSFGVRALDTNVIDEPEGVYFTSNQRVADQLMGYRRGERFTLQAVKERGQKHESHVVKPVGDAPPPRQTQPANGNGASQDPAAQPPRKKKPRDLEPKRWPELYARCLVQAQQARTLACDAMANDEAIGPEEAGRIYDELGAGSALHAMAASFFIQLMRS